MRPPIACCNSAARPRMHFGLCLRDLTQFTNRATNVMVSGDLGESTVSHVVNTLSRHARSRQAVVDDQHFGRASHAPTAQARLGRFVHRLVGGTKCIANAFCIGVSRSMRRGMIDLPDDPSGRINVGASDWPSASVARLESPPPCFCGNGRPASNSSRIVRRHRAAATSPLSIPPMPSASNTMASSSVSDSRAR